MPWLEDEAAAQGLPVFDARFDGPAHFPLPKPTPWGEPLYDEGVVIYEGMRLVVAPDGHYEVSFVASTPATPVTLRMQLVAMDQTGRAIPMTLPPISIVPERGFDGNCPTQMWQVRVSGYSRLLGLRFSELSCQTVTRTGTARFGSWPEGINQFNRLGP